MAKQYSVFFGNTAITGLHPTFSTFNVIGQGSTTPPGITETPTSSGLYSFQYDALNAINFIIDGFTTQLANSRYVFGQLDPSDIVYEFVGNTLYPMGVSSLAYGNSLTAQGVSLNAIGVSILSALTGASSINTLIGGLSSSFGNTSADPTTVFGYLKRLQEFNEGNSVFNKSTSLWDIYSRGSSTLLIEKSLNDTTGIVTKS